MSERLNLPWSVMGRPTKPVALGLAMLCAILAVSNVFGADSLGDSLWSHVVIPVAGVAALLFTAAWWRIDQRFLEWALLLAFGLHVARAAFIPLATGWSGFAEQDAWQSLAVAVIAGGAYLLEKGDRA